MLLFFKKTLAFLKNYWHIPLIGIGALALYSFGKKSKIDFGEILEGAHNFHKKDLEIIDENQKKKEEKKKEVQNDFLRKMASVENGFLRSQRELDKEKRREVEKIVKKYQKNPDKISDEIAKKYGFKIVPPKR